MSNIVGIGANVHDTLIKVNSFPCEDTKMRAEEIKVCGGGPCGTGLVAASKLGGDCSYIGVLSDDASGTFLVEDFKRYGVGTDMIRIQSGSSFSSYVILNTENATRSCIAHRGTLPALVLDDEQKSEISKAEILMVDGNEMQAAICGASYARECGVHVLYDAGSLYKDVDKLLPFADILIPSEEFALNFTQTDNAQAAAKELYKRFKPLAVVITCGKNGGVLFDGVTLQSYPAFSVSAVDTNGAGDVFHGAFAFGITHGFDFYKCCVFSSAVSAIKCTKTGAREGAPKYKEVIKFLKESGYNEFEENMER